LRGSCSRLLCRNTYKATRLRNRYGLQNPGHQGQEVADVIATSSHRNDGKAEADEMLLERDALVYGDEHVEVRGRPREQLSVSKATPTLLLDRTNLVARKFPTQSPGHTLVKQQSH